MPVTRNLLVKAVKSAAMRKQAHDNFLGYIGTQKENLGKSLLRECGQRTFDDRVDDIITGGELDATCTDTNLNAIIALWEHGSTVTMDDWDGKSLSTLRSEYAVDLNRLVRALVADEDFRLLVNAEHPELERDIDRYRNGGDNCGACKVRLFNAALVRVLSLKSIALAYGNNQHGNAAWLEDNYSGDNDVRLVLPVRKENGAGKVFECDNNTDAYEALMAEVADLYAYRTATLRFDEPTAGRMQVWLA